MDEERVRTIMEHEGLDALIASSPENVLYFSGFRSMYQTLFRNYQTYAVYPREKGLEQAIITSIAEADNISQSSTTVKDIRFYGTFYVEYRERTLNESEKRMYQHMKKRSHKSAVDALVEVMKDRGLDDATIGLDGSNVSIEIFESIRQSLPHTRIKPTYRLTSLIRSVKTREEVEVLREAARITEKAITESLKEVKVGRTVNDVGKVVSSTLLAEGAQPIAVVIGSGETAAFPNATPTGHRLKEGDILRYDVVCLYNNYYSDLGRTAVIGTPREDLRKAYSSLLEGLEAEIESIKPGVRPSRVFQVAVEKVKAAGLTHYRRHHCGHGIGLELYEAPIINPSDETVIEKDMVLNVETPYYELGFGGIIIEETLRVRDHGADMLSKSPRSLIVL